MSESSRASQTLLVLRVSVPASGGLRVVAVELAAKVAEHVGAAVPDPESVGIDLEKLAGRVAPAGTDAEIGFEFRKTADELLIEARCEGQASELRYRLPA